MWTHGDQNIADNVRAIRKLGSEVSVTLRRFALPLLTLVALSAPAAPLIAQAGRGGGPPIPAVVSPELSLDRKITFRVYAPKAQAIRLNAGDIPGVGQTAQ